MLEAAKRLYDEFLDRQKHFRPEDRLEFIQGFLKQYCADCGGFLVSGSCHWCDPPPVVALQLENPAVESGNDNLAQG